VRRRHNDCDPRGSGPPPMPTTDLRVRHAAPDSCSPGRQSSQPADVPTKAGAAAAKTPRDAGALRRGRRGVLRDVCSSAARIRGGRPRKLVVVSRGARLLDRGGPCMAATPGRAAARLPAAAGDFAGTPRPARRARHGDDRCRKRRGVAGYPPRPTASASNGSPRFGNADGRNRPSQTIPGILAERSENQARSRPWPTCRQTEPPM
jgi:hypothetical protein